MSETDNDSGVFESRVFFTTKDESSGARLLVEDAVYAEHKSSINFSRIFNEPEPQHTDQLNSTTNIYDGSEEMRMASDKMLLSEESMGFGSGTSIFDESGFHLSTMIVAILIGIGSFFGLMVFWRKRK
jgi:hypothetical protein